MPKSLDKPKNRRLPGAAPSENGKGLAKRHSHRDVLQDLSIAEPHRDICKLNHGRAQCIPSPFLHSKQWQFTFQTRLNLQKSAKLLKRLLVRACREQAFVG